MFRTVFSNAYRVQGLLDLVKRLEWNYLAVINSYGHDGEHAAMKFISKFSNIGACLGKKIDLPQETYSKDDPFDKAVASLQKDHRLKTIVLFTKNDDSRRIMLAFKRKKLEGFYRIICAFGCKNYMEVVEGLEDVALGTISLDAHYKRQQDFKTYFLSLSPKTNTNSYFIKFWQEIFNCSVNFENRTSHYSGLTPCTGEEKLVEGRGYYPLTPVHTVTNAVYSVAYAVKRLIKTICHKDQKWMVNTTECIIQPSRPHEFSDLILKYLPDISYPDGTLKSLDQATNEYQYDIHLFTKKSEKYKSIQIGKWTLNKRHHNEQSEMDQDFQLDLTHLRENGSKSYFLDICRELCNTEHKKIPDLNILILQCCRNCQQCPPNKIVKNYSCIPCNSAEVLIEGNCVKLPERYLDTHINPTHPFQVTMLVLCVTGLLLTLVVVALFIKYNGNRIVRSCGRDLCYLILTGVAILFLCPFPFLTKPSKISCMFRRLLPGIAFLTCYAPLFLKIYRIYRIYRHSQTSVARPKFVSSKFLLLSLFGIVSFQSLIATIWLVLKMPHPAQVLPSHQKYIILTCTEESSPILVALHLGFSVIFMASSTVLAFKTRHFPKNYRESKYIGITLYITCIAWALFIPGYFLASPNHMEFLKEHLMCTICVSIGYITLLGLFGSKVKLLLCTSKDKLNEMSREERRYIFNFDATHNNEMDIMEQVQ